MTPVDDREPQRFGRYELQSELGRGAMGIVYKARDPQINRMVAVKTISLAGHAPVEESEYRARFIREAEAAGRISHPGIVTIFDVGEDAKTRNPYLVMEFVGGESLESLLSRGDHKLPVERALQLAIELAEALDCAHSQGVVHRDLKPANILLTEDGHAKIADFGVAKLNLANHTLAGRALGTPAYMSPEQLNGEAVDGRSDLFSLGVILYTALTGYRPFQGNSAVTVSFKVVNRDPLPPTVLDTELPEGLDNIIVRAMAKDPAERYQRGSEMAADLRNLLGSLEPLPVNPLQRASEKSKSHGNPWVAAKLLFSARSLPIVPTDSRRLERIRRRSIAGVVAVVTLFLLGLALISVRPRHLPSADVNLGAQPDVSVRTSTTPSAQAPPPAAPPAKQPPKATRSNHLASNSAKPAHPVSSAASAPATSPATTSSAALSPAALSTATLEIEVDHKFAQARLSIAVDGTPSYTHVLEGEDRKRLVVFHHFAGHEIHSMPIAPGKHSLRVRVTSDSESYDQVATLAGEFASGQESVLHIICNKRGELNLSLSLQ